MPGPEAALEERVRSLAVPVLARHRADLIDVAVRRGRGHLVRLTVDRDDGIDLETCARISEEVSRLLDADDPIPGRYTLEVSSPGADRPLRTERDFRRNLGRPVRVVMATQQHEGTLEEVTAEQVMVGGRWISLTEIAKARVVLPWEHGKPLHERKGK